MLSIICLLVLLFLSACRASAQPRAEGSPPCRPDDAVRSAPARDGATPFDVASHPDFARYEAALRDYLTRHTRAAEADFCVIGFAHASDWRKAWIVWPRGGRVLEWLGGASDVDPAHAIELDRDVVSSHAELHGSTYLVTREWVARLVSACDCYGRKVHVSVAARRH